MPVSLAAIARTLDTPAELGPHLAEVFAPLSSLGCRPGQIVLLLRAGGVGAGSRVIDLGCGKGAAAIAAAKALRCRIDAFDAYEPFIIAARHAAARAGVADRCRFRVADAATFEARRAGRADAAMMLAVWPAARAARVLRRLVKPGGVYVIDDAVLTPGAPPRFRRTGLRTAEEFRDLIAFLGDRVERERIHATDESRRHEEGMHARLVRRCDTLARRDPGLRPALRRMLAQQRASINDLFGPLLPAVWLVRRGASDSSKAQSRLLGRTRSTRSRH